MGRVSTRLDYGRFTGSPEMRALFYAALSNAGILSRDGVSLTVGIPLGFVSGDDVKTRVGALREWMSGQHEWQEGKRERSANIVNVNILSQPHAAYLDHVFDMNGSQTNNALAGEVGIVSLGFNTMELMVIEDGKPSRRFSGSDKVGVRRLLESINATFGNAYNLAELDLKLRAGKLDIRNAAHTWNSEIAAAIERMWDGADRRFTQIIAVGGGLRFANDTLKSIFGSRLVVPEDSVLSIARGLYKFGVK
jgi:hypothetical protein